MPKIRTDRQGNPLPVYAHKKAAVPKDGGEVLSV